MGPVLDRREQAESIPVPAACLGPLAQKDYYTRVTYFEVIFFLFMRYMHLSCVPVCVHDVMLLWRSETKL